MTKDEMLKKHCPFQGKCLEDCQFFAKRIGKVKIPGSWHIAEDIIYYCALGHQENDSCDLV